MSANDTPVPTRPHRCDCPECFRRRDRIERLRGLCKTLCGCLADCDYDPIQRNELWNLIGDAEPPDMTPAKAYTYVSPEHSIEGVSRPKAIAPDDARRQGYLEGLERAEKAEAALAENGFAFQAAQNESLREIAALKVEAKRFRWLRKQRPGDTNCWFMTDAAIDAAIAAEGKP